MDSEGEEKRLVFEKFIDMYPQMAQELYDNLATEVWFLDKHFEDGDVTFSNDNGTIRIIDIEESEGKSLGREIELKALNKFFEENFPLNPVKFRPPSFFIGLTKSYSGDEDCKVEWEIKNIIGRGHQGITYLACCQSECTHVMKVEGIKGEIDRKSFEKEAEVSIELGNKGIGPKIVAEYVGKNIRIIIMEKLTMTLVELLKMWKEKGPKYFGGGETLRILKKKYVDVVRKLHNMGYVHGDLHENNVMLKIHKDNLVEYLRSGQYKLKLIDFGRIGSTQFGLAGFIMNQSRIDSIIANEENFDNNFTIYLIDYMLALIDNELWDGHFVECKNHFNEFLDLINGMDINMRKQIHNKSIFDWIGDATDALQELILIS